MTTPKTTTKTGASTELGSKLAYLTRALKTPTIGRVWDDLATQARELNCSYGSSSLAWKIVRRYAGLRLPPALIVFHRLSVSVG